MSSISIVRTIGQNEVVSAFTTFLKLNDKKNFTSQWCQLLKA